MENMNNQENNNLEVIEGTNFVVDLSSEKMKKLF